MGEDERKRYRARPGKRPTIGYLAHTIQDANQLQWSGVVDEAAKRGANLLCFVGGCWADPRGFQAQANILYDLVSAENVDGVISRASLIGTYVTADELRAFHERYRSLPLVTIGRSFEGLPSVAVSSYEGMRLAIIHLIKVHGCRRLAFISGPEDNLYAQERYQAYADALQAHSLPLDPKLVAPPVPWEIPMGMKSMNLLLDERHLRPQVDFDAVVAASDTLLLGALQTLQARGIQVPEDVAAVGFNNIMQGRVSTPPLTSVATPFDEEGHQAVEMLLALMEGAQVSAKTIMASRLVIRQSCGCLNPAVEQAAAGPVEASSGTLEPVLASRRAQILSAMAQAIGEPEKADGDELERLLDGFAGELKGETPGLLVRELEKTLRQTAAAGGDVTAWQGAISALRRQTLPYLRGEAWERAEDLWQQARVAIGEMAQRSQAQAQLQAAQQAQALREIGAALITTFDMKGLMNTLAEELPRLGIPSGYLALYENPLQYRTRHPQSAPEWSRLMLAYDERGSVALEPEGRRFPSRQLLPEGMLPQERPYCFVVEPLYFQESQLGFVLFEVGPREANVYEVLRAQIGSALQGALLVRQVERRALQLQTASEVSQAVSSILDPDELIRQVVDLACTRFDLYYAGLFLVDQSGEWTGKPNHWAVLRAGTGEAGRKMLEEGHKLEIGGVSMIGWAVANKRARIALDVGTETVRFANPLLPETHSEMALPLISRGEAIGALTIQSERKTAFSQDDIAALQTMASQVANAIENARLFDQSRIALAEMEAAQRRYIERAWTEYIRVIGTSGYRQTGVERIPLDKQVLPEVRQTMAEQRPLVWQGDGDTDSLLVVPVMLRGQSIGAIGFRSAGEKRGWSAEEIALVETISEQLALAAENLRLIDETQRRAARERLIGEITDKMRRATNVEEIVQTAVNELFNSLRTTRTFVRLGTALPERDDGHPGT